jgi:hypothetical protein
MMKILAKSKKRIQTLLLAAAILPGLTACTDDEVGLFIGAVVIGAIVANAPSGSGGSSHDRDHHDNHGGHGYRGSITVDVADLENAQQIDLQEFADRYQMSTESASIFISAMNTAKQGDGKAVADLGLSHDELNALSKYDMPSDAGIEAVAKSIKAETVSTKNMIQDILQTAIQQKNTANNTNAMTKWM